MKTIILDTETTGLVDPVAVEIAWLEVLDPKLCEIGEQFEQRYNPGKPITYGAMATHGILPRDVEDCPPASSFALPPDTAYVIGHNVDFDMQVIGCHVEPPKRICTLALCRKLWPEVDSHSQMAMLYRFDPETAQAVRMRAHGALVDAQVCHLILCEIVDKIRPKTWEELWQQSEVARVPEIFTFGKHKGVRIKDAPADYKAWMLRQPDVDQYLAKALRA